MRLFRRKRRAREPIVERLHGWTVRFGEGEGATTVEVPVYSSYGWNQSQPTTASEALEEAEKMVAANATRALRQGPVTIERYARNVEYGP